ncbi:MAG TPA: PilZ domain-containing protein [Novosphingobium sp.]
MDGLENDGAGLPGPVSYDDLRAAPRFALLIRSAKLITESGEYLCIIRDVSISGVRLKIFHPLPAVAQPLLELSTGDRFLLDPVWEREGHAGFRFANPIDVHRFIAEASPYPKRALRLRMEFPATLIVDGQGHTITVRDFSRQGAKIESQLMLAISQKIKLEAKGMPGIVGNVCWRSTPAYGLSFQQTFTFEELALLAYHFQPVVPPPSGITNHSPKRYA